MAKKSEVQTAHDIAENGPSISEWTTCKHSVNITFDTPGNYHSEYQQHENFGNVAELTALLRNQMRPYLVVHKMTVIHHRIRRLAMFE